MIFSVFDKSVIPIFKFRHMTSYTDKGYNMPLVELQNFLNDLVTDSPHLGRHAVQGLNLP
jgi:hypothetical protein